MPGTVSTAALLVVAAAVSQEVGAAIAVGLIGTVGPAATLLLRMGFAAIALCAVARPRPSRIRRESWPAIVAVAGSLTAMNLSFYNAIGRIPLGIAVTVEVCGPLLLSIVLSRRKSAWLLAVLAFAGVALTGLRRDGPGVLDPLGFGFACCAAAAWAGYIVSSRRLAVVVPKLDGLAVATTIGTLAIAPFAAATGRLPDILDGKVLAVGLVVALSSSAIPYSLEVISLRTLAPETFAVVTCISPAVAALAGWAILQQRLHWPAVVGIVMVCAACVWAVRLARSAGGTRAPYTSAPVP